MTPDAPHPFRQVGAHAAAILTGRPDPQDVTAADLDAVVERIAADAAKAASALKGGPGYAWWLALNAAYPNSAPTHPSRKGDITERVLETFAADETPVGPCWLCGQPASVRWGKDRWPLAEPAQHLNSSPAGGWLICRACRICLWCLPYGSVHNGGKIITMDSPDPVLTRAMVAAAVEINLDAISQEWSTWPSGADDTACRIAYDAIIAHPRQVEIHQVEIRLWRNDNRGATMTEWVIPEGIASWLARHAHDPDHQAGLRILAEVTGHHPIAALRCGWADDPLHRLSHLAMTATGRMLDEGRTVGDVAPLASLVLSAAGGQ